MNQVRRQIKCKEKILMLFYGGIFLHYKKFVNKFLWLGAHVNKFFWLGAHVHKIFRSCAHAHMIGEHKKPARLFYF